MKLNRPQVLALFSLAMELGIGCEFTFLSNFTIGSIMIEATDPMEGTVRQYMLPAAGGHELLPEPTRREQGASTKGA